VIRRLPTWAIPWLVPLVMLIVVVAAAIAFWLAVVVLGVCGAVIVPYLRLRHLREHPPAELQRGNSSLWRRPADPELRRKNFWDLS
jgi:hypothetical protein